MNMVRAGAVTYPREWAHGGYHEIQYPRQRYRLVDRERFRDLAGASGSDNFFDAHVSWGKEPLRMNLGHLVRGRKARETSAGWELREDISPYNTDFPSQNGGLRPENLYLWNETVAFPRG
jgi:putative transposase